MKLLFYYSSERVYHDKDGNLYTSGNFTSEVWDRYLNISDELYVVMTDSGQVIKKSIAEKTKQRIDTDKIHVHLVPDRYASITNYLSMDVKRKINQIQKEVFQLSDFAIIRPSNSRAIAKYRKTGKPYAIEVVGCPWDAFWNHDIKGKILAPHEYYYSRREVKRAAYVLYVTKYFLQRRYPTKGITINCSNVSLNPPDDSILDDRLAKIEKNKGHIVIGTAAALNVKYKGQQYVIQALAKLKDKGLTNFEYQVVGGGDPSHLKRTACKYGVLDQVKIIGQVAHAQIFDWLEQLDVYIQPSLQEGLPRSVIEAMSYGLPCAGTRLAGIPELLDNEMMFKGKAVEEIVSILEHLNKKQMKELAKKNFEKAKEYDVEVLKNRRNDFYNDFRRYAEKKGKSV